MAWKGLPCHEGGRVHKVLGEGSAQDFSPLNFPFCRPPLSVIDDQSLLVTIIEIFY